ncbi:C40 family peptidase [Kitasatospora sp. NBC_00315]|uniref:C40 family peptidase n=1 Tax=Kitasatospora sp. NBC_00315 TaxID=2975963 RepID=UPI0032529D1C
MARRLLPVVLLALTAVLGLLPAAGASAAAVSAGPPPVDVPATVATPPDATPPDAPPAEEAAAPPSTDDIARARADADRRAAATAAVEGRLTEAAAERDRAIRTAEQAVEVYNGAQARLLRARAEESAALQRAAVAELARYQATDDAARLAAETYRQGATAELSAIDALFGAPGPRAAGAQAAVVGVVSGRIRQILDAATGTAADAARASATARQATAAAERAAAAVRAARDGAQARTQERQSVVAELGLRREQLLSELAAARDTTVDLERRRRDALEEIAARAAEAAARAAAERVAAEQAAAERAAEDRAAADRAAGEAAASGSAASGSGPERPAADRGAVAPQSGGPGRWSAQGAESAIAYARSRIGLPYVWGGEGPAGYDCSGLTMMAWRSGGRALTHFAADQYAESTPVTYRRLRPGDLVFWSDTGRAADIFHVALYIGDDQMIEAPREGAAVKQASLWIMGTPDFYARP